MRKLQMILLCEAVGKNICRVDVHVDEHMWTCEYLVLLCNAVNQRYDIPMDMPLVDEHQWVYQIIFYIVQESNLHVVDIMVASGGINLHYDLWQD